MGKLILLTAPKIYRRAVPYRIVLVRAICILLLLLLIASLATSAVYGQETGSWTPVKTIPGYHPETDPPVLIADQNRTVHAFSSQFAGDDELSEQVIVYNKWSFPSGWTEPNDIILPPKKGQARLLGAELDQSGMMHVLFFSGDETEADIYYSKAPAVKADHARAWTDPKIVGKNALIPENGAIASDGLGNMLIVYSGRDFSHGLYVVFSSDGGSTWTDLGPLFLTHRYDLFPFNLKMFLGDSGLLHAVWSVHDISNHGQEIYYASFDFDQRQWSNLKKLALSVGGLGTQVPTIIEHDDILFVMYYTTAEGGRQTFIRSDDLGQTWTDPTAPFPHVGLNGPGSFVVDSNGDLHFFWGQRITGSPDIHGMWHSVWQEVNWSPYEAIVSGTKILDKVGDTSFDPVTPHAAISQGNAVLVVWRTDYGSKGNGVWFSYKVLDAPESPVSPLPVPQVEMDGTEAPTIDRPTLDVSPSPSPTIVDVNFNDDSLASSDVDNPIGQQIVGLIPVILVFGLIIVYQLIRYGR